MEQPQLPREVLELLGQLKIDPQDLSSEEIAQLNEVLERHAARRGDAQQQPLLARIAAALAGGRWRRA